MARLFQWSNQGLDQKTLDHVKDLPRDEGSAVLLCPCGKEFVLGERIVCPHCEGDLVFPRCEW